MKSHPPIPSCSNENFCFHMGEYSFGFNGKELDKEGLGGGASTYDYGFRIYNSALAKFLSVDPLKKDYPWYTPYQFAGNKPIIAIDLDGLEEYVQINKYNADGEVTEITIVCVRDIETGKPQDLELWKHEKFKGAEGKALAILHLTENGMAEYAPPTYQDELSKEQRQILNKFGASSPIEIPDGRTNSWNLTTPEPYKDELPERLSKIFDDGMVCRAKVKLNYEISIEFVGGTDKIVGDVTKELEPIGKLMNGIEGATATIIGNTGHDRRFAGIIYGKSKAALDQSTTLNNRTCTIGDAMLARASAVTKLLTTRYNVNDPSGDRIKEEKGEHFPEPSGRHVDVKIKVNNIGQIKK